MENEGGILITGAGGFIGGGLFERLKRFNPIGVVSNVNGSTNDKNSIEADLRDKAKVKEIFDAYRPSIVFHFAAFSSPQRNEKNPQFAQECNTGITKNIIDNLSDDAHIIFPSTDKVFDGTDPNPHEESDMNPLWQYAELKCQCEELIKRNIGRYHIVRLPIVHSLGSLLGARRGSFIDKAIIDLKEGKEVSVFKNVKRCFLKLEELLDLFEIFINDTNYGIYNVGTTMMNYYDRMCVLCDELRIDGKDRIVPVEGMANPLEQNLNTDKLYNTFRINLT